MNYFLFCTNELGSFPIASLEGDLGQKRNVAVGAYRMEVQKATKMTDVNSLEVKKVGLTGETDWIDVYTNRKVPIYFRSNGSFKSCGHLWENVRLTVKESQYRGWWQTVIGNYSIYIQKHTVRIDRGIPILLYHHILPNVENTPFFGRSTTISVASFQQQMEMIRTGRYITMSNEQLEHFLNGTLYLPAKTVVIHFDDGLKSSSIFAAPILRRYNLQAVQFLISRRIQEKPIPFDDQTLQFLSWSEMETMADVFSYDCHSYELHRFDDNNRPLMIALREEEVLQDLEHSRKRLKSPYFAFPFGVYNERAKRILRRKGYRLAFTTKPSLVTAQSDRLELGRFQVTPEVDLQQFQSMIEGTYDAR